MMKVRGVFNQQAQQELRVYLKNSSYQSNNNKRHHRCATKTTDTFCKWTSGDEALWGVSDRRNKLAMIPVSAKLVSNMYINVQCSAVYRKNVSQEWILVRRNVLKHAVRVY